MVKNQSIMDVVDAIKNHKLDLYTWTQSYLKKDHLDAETKKAFVDGLELMSLIDESYHTPAGTNCQIQAVGMMALLDCLNLDPPILLAAMLYNAAQYADLTIDVIGAHSNQEVVKLIEGVQTMDALHHVYQSGVAAKSCHAASDNLRRMMLAMVNDVRIVMIKLTEQICLLRHLKHFTESQQRIVANETMMIYAPLANRLGIAQLKWQLEDMAFRFLQPHAYQKISKGLQTKRTAREKYVRNMVNEVETLLGDNRITIHTCSGRAKHIYSIYRKMEKKSVSLEQIYDAIAIRVILTKKEDCYDALSLVHERWTAIPEEFDDYISSPKPNGYQSIHTAVLGPKEKAVEIQIRSKAMHDAAEFGVASHWLYKEGKNFATYRNKVDWLNQLTTLQQDRDETHAPNDFERHTVNLFQDRVFVFTPNGEVKDLPKGATALDFAYAIHTQVGHRCKGVKINGNIATFKTVLTNADRVEILTSKHENPSHDWLKEDTGYLKTARARSKVAQWFRQLKHEEFVERGRGDFEKECKRLKLTNKISFHDCARQESFTSVDEMFVAIGQGEKNSQAIIKKWQTYHDVKSIQEDSAIASLIKKHAKVTKDKKTQPVEVVGCEGMKLSLANCCHPLPDDDIIGWISRSRGVIVHRKQCRDLHAKSIDSKERFVEVIWQSHIDDRFVVAVKCKTTDLSHTSLALQHWLNQEKTVLCGLSSSARKTQDNTALMSIEVMLSDIEQLQKLLGMLSNLKFVHEVWRV